MRLQTAFPPVRPHSSRSSANNFARVRVARPEPHQNSCLERLHALRLRVCLMIVADEVQKSMGEEVAVMIGERHAEVLGLAGKRLVGQRDIAKRRWVLSVAK